MEELPQRGHQHRLQGLGDPGATVGRAGPQEQVHHAAEGEDEGREASRGRAEQDDGRLFLQAEASTPGRRVHLPEPSHRPAVQQILQQHLEAPLEARRDQEAGPLPRSPPDVHHDGDREGSGGEGRPGTGRPPGRDDDIKELRPGEKSRKKARRGPRGRSGALRRACGAH